VANQVSYTLIKKFVPIYIYLECSFCRSRFYRYFYYTVHTQNALTSKSKLFVVISAVIFAVFTPLVIIPYLDHPFLLYFMSIHIASIIISVFLIIVSIFAYRRTGTKKILYTTLGFSSLLAVELLFLLQAIPGTSIVMHRGIYVGLPHILLLFMLTLFGVGVLKVER
jgi:hypothetical protein